MERYVVINDSVLTNVVESVIALLKDGYEPCGGLAVNSNGGAYFYQAMIKKDDTPRSPLALGSARRRE